MSPINSVSTPIFHYMRPYTELARLEKVIILWCLHCLTELTVFITSQRGAFLCFGHLVWSLNIGAHAHPDLYFIAWGLTMAAFHTHAPLKYYIQSLFQYLAAAVIIRSCICTVNDIVDRDIDASVCKSPPLLNALLCWQLLLAARTKKRPLPSGRISVRSALIFLFLQYSLGIVFFVTFLEGLAWVHLNMIVCVRINSYAPSSLWTALFQFIPMWVCISGRLNWIY